MRRFLVTMIVLVAALALGASAACVGSTVYNGTAANRVFTRMHANPSTGRALLHYVVPAGTAGVLIYAQACWGNLTGFTKLAYQVPSWTGTPDWVPNASLPKRGFKLLAPDANGLIYVALRTSALNGGFENANTSGIVDVLMTNEYSDMADLVPVPGGATIANDSTVTTKLQVLKGKATVTWVTTGDARDSYKVYRHDLAKSSDWPSMMPPRGMFLTACSHKCWMRVDAEATKLVTVAGTMASTTVVGLNKRNVTLVAVIVERNGGYMASYQMIALNSAQHLSLSPLILLLAAFLALLLLH